MKYDHFLVLSDVEELKERGPARSKERFYHLLGPLHAPARAGKGMGL